MRKFLLLLALLIIAGAAFVFLAPKFLDRHAEPTAGAMEGQTLVLSAAALSKPDPSPEQTFKFENNALLISVLPNQPAPTPAERGVRVLLTPESAARVSDTPVLIEIHYVVPPSGAASALAVSLQGIAPADWIEQPLTQGGGVALFEAPEQFAVDAIGLRALSATPGQGGDVTILQMRLTPAPALQPALEQAPEQPPQP